MKRLVLTFFLLVSLGELTAIIWHVELLHMVCNPLIMLLLSVYYFLAVQREFRSMALILAMICSCLGNVLLMLENHNASFFVFGLMVFLAAHIFYILAYKNHRVEGEENKLQGIQKIRLAFPIALAGTGLIVVLYPALGELKLPVMIYALIMVIMVIGALFRYGHTNSKSFWIVFSGAVLFMISDSILAVSKFLHPVDHKDFLVMFTYIVSQLMIVQGLIMHKESK